MKSTAIAYISILSAIAYAGWWYLCYRLERWLDQKKQPNDSYLDQKKF